MVYRVLVGKKCLHNLRTIQKSILIHIGGNEMTNFIQVLQEEQDYLGQMKGIVQENIQKDHKDKLTGKLRIQRKGNSVQYYHTDSNHVQTYIPKKNMKLIKNLAQRDYDNKLIEKIELRQKLLARFMAEYPQTGLEEVYEEINEYRKNLIEPIIESDERYAKNWLNAPYIRKIVGEEVPEIFTENGERVRSKSEKMIADKLKSYGVPYKYEMPLRLGRNCVIHPDFTILNVKKRKQYYYEHFGMMDNPDYAERAIRRIELYESNGIFPGDQLLCSWETKVHPLDMKLVDAMIKKYLI